MGYKIINLTECYSTQDELKNQMRTIRTFEALAVITEKQLKGRGRRGHDWVHFEKSLALSFSYRPEKILTLTALKIGVGVCEYFKKNHSVDLKLKWPNDILDNHGKKVGGIIIDIHSEKVVLVGLGLNLYSCKKLDSFITDYPISSILKSERKFNSKEFLNYFYEDFKFYQEDWLRYCFHLNKEVIFETEGETFKDVFSGIGKNGEALFLNASPQYSGSIKL